MTAHWINPGVDDMPPLPDGWRWRIHTNTYPTTHELHLQQWGRSFWGRMKWVTRDRAPVYLNEMASPEAMGDLADRLLERYVSRQEKFRAAQIMTDKINGGLR